MRFLPFVLALALLAAPAAAAPAPVSADEARSLLDALARAYRAEDVDAILALHAEPLRGRVRALTVPLFRDRNYLRLDQRVVGTTPRADGGLVVDFVGVLTSRRVAESFDRRDKSRWEYVLARLGDGVESAVSIVETRPAPRRLLAPVPTWAPDDWRIQLDLRPAPTRLGTPQGTARVRLDVVVRNASTVATGSLGFALHPFARDVEAWLGGALLGLQRDEGPGDTFWGVLPEPIAPGETFTLTLAYEIDLLGRTSHSQLGETGGYLLAESAWLPLFGNPSHDRPQRAPHDLVVEAPAGLVALAPGVLASQASVGDGRVSSRFFSRFPGDQLAVIVGAFERTEVPVGSGVTADIWRSPDATGPVPPTLVRVLRGLLAFGATVVGPVPTDRVTVVHLEEAEAPRLLAAPAFLVLRDLDLGEPRLLVPRAGEPTFFVAHHLAHLWFVDSVETGGPGAIALTEGLADQLATWWEGSELSERIPRRYHQQVLDPLRAQADLDRPVAEDVATLSGSDVFGRGKAFLAFDAFRALVGDEAWSEVLGAYWRGARGRPAELATLVTALAANDPVRERFVGRWLLGRGLADPQVVDVRQRPEGAGWQVLVRNAGVGPAPTVLRARVDGEIVETLLVLDAGEEVAWDVPGGARPVSVVLDPERVLWQARPEDDIWPAPREVAREELSSPRELSMEQIEAALERGQAARR